jgi:hypothetical protein
MAAKSKQASLSCGKCGSSVPFTFWYKISGDDYPELKLRVMDGSLFSTQCGVCKTSISVVQDLRYSDYSTNKNFFTYLCPKEDLQKSYEFIQSLPMLRNNGTRVHIVNTLAELQTIIASYDLGIHPPETFIDQSVDSARRTEDLNLQVEDFFGALLSGDVAKGLQQANKKKRCNAPWSFKNFWNRLFGMDELKQANQARSMHKDSLLGKAGQRKASELSTAWIKAGGIIGPVGIDCNIDPKFSSEAECRNFVEQALADFDREHPARRLAEPLDLVYKVVNKDGILVPAIKFEVKLKYENINDARQHMRTVSKAFFDRFEVMYT